MEKGRRSVHRLLVIAEIKTSTGSAVSRLGGSSGDLRSAETFEHDGSGWKHTGTTYYAYYTQGEAGGFVFGLKHVLGPAAVARMVADGQASFSGFGTTVNIPAGADLAAYRVSKETVYRNEDGTGAIETNYAYTWHAGTCRLEERTTTLPAVPASQNGSGIATSRTETI